MLLLSCLAAAACEQRPRSPEERGAGLFLRSCSGCHGPDGRGGRRVGLHGKSRDLTDAAFQASVSDQTLRRTIEDGKGQMPAFGPLLQPTEVADLVRFLRTLPARR